VLGLAYLVFSVAWIFGNPAGAAPDEPAHFIKALAVADGKPEGRRVAVPASPSDSRPLTWTKRTSRSVVVPSGLSPAGLPCNAFHPELSAGCQRNAGVSTRPTVELTNLGTANPSTYLLPGVLARAADTPVTAVLLARLGAALVPLALLAVAIALLWDGRARGLSLVGLIVAVTPMTIFLASTVGSSGAEITAGICFFSALLRLGREPSAPSWVWVALGSSGVVLASSRSLGPAWVGLLLAAAVCAHGARPSWRVVRSGALWAAISQAAVMVAIGLNVAWELAVQPHGTAIGTLGSLLPVVFDEIPTDLRQMVGVFGWLDTTMPEIAYSCWLAMTAALVLPAFWVGSRRERGLLLAILAGAVLVTTGVAAFNRAMTGFPMQGRYVLPVTVAVPLFAGEILVRNRRRLAPLMVRSMTALPLLAAGVQGLGWYANARRSAIGVDGPRLFFSQSEWNPAGGWYLWCGVVVLAMGLLASFAIWSSLAPRDRRSPAEPPSRPDSRGAGEHLGYDESNAAGAEV
jgi:hypothetical protein